MSVHKKALIVFFLIVVTGLSIFLLLKASRKPYPKIKEVKPDCEKLIQENLEFKNKYAKLQKDYEAVSADRDNVLFQTKFLLSQKEKVREAEASFEKMKKEAEIVEQEKKEAESKNLELQDEIEDLGKKIEELIVDKGRAINEKKQLEELIARERDKNPILKLRMRKQNCGKSYLAKRVSSSPSRLKTVSGRSR